MVQLRSSRMVLLVALVVLATSPAALAAGTCTPGPARLDTPLALVLSGGGAKGAWEAGLAIAILEQGLPLRLVAGSSAGALNAAMIADGRLDRLVATWQTLTSDHVYRLRPSIALAGLLPGWLTLLTLDRARALLDARPLRELIEASVDLERVRASSIQVVVVTMDLERRARRLFDNRTLTLDALAAAAALPGVFPPVEVDGQLLVDAGLIGRAPVLDALESGVLVERTLVAIAYTSGERGERPATLRRALEQAFEASMIHQIERDVELARLKFPRVDVQVVRPSVPIALRPLEFDAAGLARALELGRADGRECVRQWAAGGPRPSP